MSESDSFIDEVTEEVRRDRLFAYWKKYGVYVLGAIALIVAASAWWSYHRQAAIADARETGGRFLALGEAAADADEWSRLASETDAPAAVVARFHAAAASLDAGDEAAAAAIYRDIAADGTAEPVYRDLARIAAVRLDDGASRDDRLALLEPALQPGAPLRILAQEARGALLIASGDVEAGQEDLRAILDNPLATQETIARVSELLLASGGRLE